MIRKLLLACTLALSGVFSAQAAVVTMTPSSSSVTAGNSFTIDIGIQGVTNLAGWELDLSFAPASLVSMTGQADGTFFGGNDVFIQGSLDGGAGTLSYLAGSFMGSGGVSGSGLLAELTFNAILPGTVSFAFDRVLLIDANGDQIYIDNLTEWQGTSVSIVARGGGGGNGSVPEPGSLALVALALMSLSALQRQRASRRD